MICLPTFDICATIYYDTENYICSSVVLKYKQQQYLKKNMLL